mmetsp:Transcript_14207/g.39104  ORF Transcript_14207/g.39104 Transcript_14207/m.39104 type:complete len:128 (-) Transcript_14207:1933-2316(-)
MIFEARLMVPKRCAIINIVIPSLRCKSSKESCTSASVSPSKALVASSSSKRRGRLARTRARATRCFCPPLRPTPLDPTSVDKPIGKRSMKSHACARTHASRSIECSSCSSNSSPTREVAAKNAEGRP